MATQNSGVPVVDFVIDGSNVLLSEQCRIDGKPSIRVFAALLAMLEANAKKFRVYFDKSIYHLIEEFGGSVDELRQIIAELNDHSQLDIIPRADIGIQRDCQFYNAAVINGGDRNDSWRGYQPPIFRCRLNHVPNGNGITIYVAPAGRGAKIFSESVSKEFSFRGMQFPALAETTRSDVGTLWAPQPKFKGRRPHGNLLVLALDASPSMNEQDTFDGRSRAAHVNDILKATMEGLSDSSIASSLHICILSFSSDVILHTANNSGFVFSPLRDWQTAPLNDYLSGVDRNGTNIRLALDRAADYIDGFRQSETSQQLAMNWKNATVVMLTDGAHIAEINGEVEESKDILMHVFSTLNRSENVSFGFLGLGNGSDMKSLCNWGTEATPLQTELARRKDVALEAGKLCVKVNNGDDKLNNIVRSFIDVASSRVN